MPENRNICVFIAESKDIFQLNADSAEINAAAKKHQLTVATYSIPDQECFIEITFNSFIDRHQPVEVWLYGWSTSTHFEQIINGLSKKEIGLVNRTKRSTPAHDVLLERVPELILAESQVAPGIKSVT